jgi:hypothetical protein
LRIRDSGWKKFESEIRVPGWKKLRSGIRFRNSGKYPDPAFYWNIQEFQQKRNVLKNPDERLREVLVRIYNHETIADYTLPARLMFVSLNFDLVILY